MDAGRISTNDLFAHAEELLKQRIDATGGHKPADAAPRTAASPGVGVRPESISGATPPVTMGS